MTAPRSYASTKAAVGGLIVSTAVLTVAGIAAMFLDLGDRAGAAFQFACVGALAAVAVFALFVSYDAARAARRCAGKPNARGTLRAAVFCAVVCGAVSLVGVHLAWLLLVESASPTLRAHLPPWWVVDLGGLLLAIVKPMMGWVTEECEQLDAEERRAEEAAEAVRRDAAAAAERTLRHEERLAQIAAGAASATRVAETPPPAATVTDIATARPRRRNRMVETLALAGVAAMSANAAPAATPPAPIVETQAAPDAARLPRLTQDDIRRAVAALDAKNVRVSYRNVAAELGRPRSQVERAWPKGVPLAA